MPDYNEFDAAGRGWWRASRIVMICRDIPKAPVEKMLRAFLNPDA